MDKNFLLAFALSIGAIFLYYTLFPPPERPEEPVAEKKIVEQLENNGGSAVKSAGSTSIQTPVMSESEAKARKIITVDNDVYSIEFDSLDGTLKSFWLKNYKHSQPSHFDVKNWAVSLFNGEEYKQPDYDANRLVNMAGDLSVKNRIWKVKTKEGEKSINFHASVDQLKVRGGSESLALSAVYPSGMEVYKTFTFHPGSYLIELEMKIVNRSGVSHQFSPSIEFGAGSVAIGNESLPKPKVGVAYVEDSFETYDGDDVEQVLKLSNIGWAGVADTFFVTAVKTVDGSSFNAEYHPVESVFRGDKIMIPKLEYVDNTMSLMNNQEYNRKFQLYVGPKVQAEMEKFSNSFPAAMDLGWFDFLAHPLLTLLRWIQGYVVNWGVAIIILTFIVRIVMFPLAFTGMKSMRKMSQLNPQIKAIREKYKKNKERMNKEIMQFYSQNKINPMGGCLPMVLQIPIFIALYQALLPAIELRHNPFIFWMTDLSAYDYTYILPILMGVSMFVQTSLTPNPAMDATQAKMMKWMPVMMVFFFLSMPSGLVLYWVVSNMFSIVQQLLINRVLPAPVVVVKGKVLQGKAKDSKGKGKKK